MFSEFPFLLIPWRKRNFTGDKEKSSLSLFLEILEDAPCIGSNPVLSSSIDLLVCTIPACTFVKVFLCPSCPWLCIGLLINRGHLYYCFISRCCAQNTVSITVSSHQGNCRTPPSIIFVNHRQIWPKPPNCGISLYFSGKWRPCPPSREEERKNLQGHLEALHCEVKRKTRNQHIGDSWLVGALFAL